MQKQFIVPISRKDSHKTGPSDRHWISIGYYSGYQSVPSIRPVDIQRMIAATWEWTFNVFVHCVCVNLRGAVMLGVS